MVAPLEIPPWIPPELFELVVSLAVSAIPAPALFSETSGAATKGSLWIEPGTSQPPKPEPISKPLVAGMLIMAWPSLASNLSKAGSPRPMGTFLITHMTVPPILSLLSRKVSMTLVMRSDASVLGHRTGANLSTVSRSMDSINFKNSGFVE